MDGKEWRLKTGTRPKKKQRTNSVLCLNHYVSSDQEMEMGGLDSRRASEVGDHLTLEATTDAPTQRKRKKKKAISTGETTPLSFGCFFKSTVAVLSSSCLDSRSGRQPGRPDQRRHRRSDHRRGRSGEENQKEKVRQTKKNNKIRVKKTTTTKMCVSRVQEVEGRGVAAS